MRFTDGKFRKNVWTYIFQCSLATLFILIVLLILDATMQTAIIASIGASSFIVFTAPNAYSAKTRALLGGYATGLLAGLACSIVAGILESESTVDWSGTIIVMGALAVGLSIFIMVITDCEHPPAAGLALAFVLNSWGFKTILVVLTAPLILALMRHLFRDHIKDLV